MTFLYNDYNYRCILFLCTAVCLFVSECGGFPTDVCPKPHCVLASPGRGRDGDPRAGTTTNRRGRMIVIRKMVAKGGDDNDDRFESLRPETSFASENVPEGQRPVNEYLDMTSQPFFNWAATGTNGLLTRLGIFYSLVFALVCYPISGATFTQDGYLLQKLTASNVGATSVLFVFLIRLYSGWSYIGQRLSSKVVEYEETGWYDGDWEEKTETEQRRDRMLFANEVKPVVDRLKVFTAGSGGLVLASILCYNVALSTAANPMFDQYNPDVLGRLSYDDKLADSAAMSTGGRPAYCDSRYYSAVANGGMGCN